MSGYLSTSDAAARLGTTPGRVRALIASGMLPAERVGGRWLVSHYAVADRGETLPVPIRSMSARIAWAAAALVDGLPVGWLGSDELSRLRRRIREDEGDPVTWRAWLRRREAVTHRFAASDLDALLGDEQVVATGISAARAYGSDLGSAGEAEVYLDTGAALAALRRRHGLVASSTPNLTVRVADGPWPGLTATVRRERRVVPAAIVAADLMAASDSRSRHAAEAVLRRALDRG
jgi:excisionase family DNA binding protein